MTNVTEDKVSASRIWDDDPENNWKRLVVHAGECVNQGCAIDEDHAVLWADSYIKELEEKVDEFECEAGYQEQIRAEESER